tara:strand:+ start:43 stop:573 length:531 start_codon:yes stop_codon:yes gene_type:complete
MREIKFRAWERVRKWVMEKGYTDELIWRMNYKPEIDGDVVSSGGAVADINLGLVSGKYFYLMQYTGLKYRNSKEIYEGDIVSWFFTCPIWEKDRSGDRSYKSPNTIGEYVNYQVVFKEGMFGLNIEDGFYPLSEYIEIDDFKVIGNIYENPELLNNTQCNCGNEKSNDDLVCSECR